MFIERSAARIRIIRRLFLLAGVLPCALLVGWSTWLNSDARRADVRDRWRQAIGLPLEIDAVEHPRPGVVRAVGCVILAADGQRLVELPVVELEAAAEEDRIRIESLACDAEAAATLVGLGREWLLRDARFPRSCVVEIANFSWRRPGMGGAPTPDEAAAGGRLECVVHEGSRALRLVRGADEARVVRTLPRPEAPDETIAFDAEWSEPVPVAALAAAFGGRAAIGAGATITGVMHGHATAAAVDGHARGRIDGVDLGACAGVVHAQAAGRATLSIERLEWRRGRLVDAVVSCTAGEGWLDDRLFDRLTVALGCRPGPAAMAGGGERAFEAAGVLVRCGPQGIELLALPGNAGALILARGGALLLPPPAAAAPDRLAWLLAPPNTAFVPAQGPGAWLMSILPTPGAGSGPSPGSQGAPPRSTGAKSRP